MPLIKSGNTNINKTLLPVLPAKEAVGRHLLRPLQGCYEAEKSLLHTHISLNGINLFLYSLQFAFDYHFPFTLSPDMLWLLICQGTATHINQDPEKYRSRLVDFSGKQDIEIRRDDFMYDQPNPWHEVITEFSEAVNKKLKSEWLQTFRPGFSTSGANETAACEITFLDSLSAFFKLTMYSLCGIPEIHLEGKKADWELCLAKLDRLNEFDLDWWTAQLKKHITIIIDSYDHPDAHHDFWNSMFKLNQRSGGPFISGWITEFFPYLKHPEKNKGFVKNEFGNDHLTFESFPASMSSVPFNWIIELPYTRYKMDLASGFIGMSQNKRSFALRPEIGWAVYDTAHKLDGAVFVKEKNTIEFIPKP